MLKGGHVSLVAGANAMQSAVAEARHLALGALAMSRERVRDYPRCVTLGGVDVTLRLHDARLDPEPLLAFARALPAHDLLFLRRRHHPARRGRRLARRHRARRRVITMLAERDGAVHRLRHHPPRRAVVVAARRRAAGAGRRPTARQGPRAAADPGGVRAGAEQRHREDGGADDARPEGRDRDVRGPGLSAGGAAAGPRQGPRGQEARPAGPEP